MTLGRREFLGRLGGVLTALSIGDIALAGLFDTYQQALARSPRRLALLVGVNQYPDSVLPMGAPSKRAPLQGALMDVELQRELLIHRFGVPSPDIMTLVDNQVTRQGVLDAIQGHLGAQVQPGDTVLFHFSGLGGQVRLTGHPEAELLPTLVTTDGRLPTETTPVIQDLFEETLAQALGNLQGARVITVLDAGHAATWKSPMQGNFRVRSRFMIPTGEWRNETEMPFQEPSKTVESLSVDWPGLLLRASKPGLPALEGNWSGFSAGLFTYALTQQIWSSFPAQRQQWIFQRVERMMETWTGAEVSPQLQGQLSTTEKENLLIAGGIPKPAATGVVKLVDRVNKSALLWLGGLPATILPYCEGLRLRLLPALPGSVAVPQGTLLVKTVKGLSAKADLLDTESVPVESPLIEVERRLPREVFLTVALDASLERIERVDATSALAGLPFITTTPSGEQQVDCLFGRFKADEQLGSSSNFTNQTQEQRVITAAEAGEIQSGYSLFSPDHTLLPRTVPDADEAVKTAVVRLNTPLRNLLAVKLLRLTANQVSSQLPVILTLETLEPESKVLAIEETLRSRQLSGSSSAQREKLALSSQTGEWEQRFRIRLQNLDQQALYYLIIRVVEQNRISVYCGSSEQAMGTEQTTKMIAESSQINSGDNLTFPRLASNALSSPQLQAVEIFAVSCTQPFYETWKTIRKSDVRKMSDRLVDIPDPLPMAKAILQDINHASLQEQSPPSPTQETVISLSSRVWSTLFLRSPIRSA